jgi:antitoxin component YwqK of YwqJK toxin-antitoxin module
MIKPLFFLALISLNFNCALANFAIDNFNYQGDKINKKDASGKKQGKWIYYGKDRPDEGYPIQGKIEEGFYRDDRKEGVWIKYHNDGFTPKLKGMYVNHRANGHFVKFHSNGKIKETGFFQNGQYQDSLKRYNEFGQLEYEANYNESGKEQGKVRFYYPDGKIEFEYYSQNGVPTGNATRYYENGEVKQIIEFGTDGSINKSETKEIVNTINKTQYPNAVTEKAPTIIKPIVKLGKFQVNGYNKVYNEQDEIWQDGDFKDGRLNNGKVYVYDRDGILLKVKVFKNGVYHSDGQL